jgi:ADP-ribose pyrophosphatase
VTTPPAAGSDITDVPERWRTVASEVLHRTGWLVALRRDEVAPPDDAETFTREVVEHPGAVAILAVDETDHVLVLRQYRHPVGHRLVEIPAGLLDVDGEPYAAAAARELAEEAHVRASWWRVLVDFYPSPGINDESVRVFLARGLFAVPEDERYAGRHEEAHMTVERVPLDALVRAVLAGRIHSASLCIGVLAATAARAGAGWDALRPADAQWPAREAIPRLR